MGILITAEGEEKVVTPDNGEVFTLKELQTHVGGWIEVVPQRIHPDKVYLCDEEGLLKGKDVNSVVSEVIDYPVVGDILIISHEEWE